MTDLSDRISIKCVILGCVSAGKSTLVNAILVNKLSDIKIRRTTMLPQVYLESSISDNITDILNINNKTNQDILNGSFKLTQETCKNIYHKIPKLFDIFKLPSDIHIDIYDIPGLNDNSTEDIYYQYIKNTFCTFDIIFVVVSITESFNTSCTIKILDKIIENSKKK